MAIRTVTTGGVAWAGWWLVTWWVAVGAWADAAAAVSVSDEWKGEIEPILADYCYDCHGDGASKGDLAMDEFGSLEEHLDNHQLWLRVWRHVRSQLMPPARKMQPDRVERERLLRWIERRVFALDPDHPDPGRVTIRRLNREEYRNTIRDLLGVDYDTRENFPPDDTGYGFDTIGDVLSLSPLLLEKYVRAAEEIAVMAMPVEATKPPEVVIGPGDLRQPGKESETGRAMEFERDHTVRAVRELRQGGRYAVELGFRVGGSVETAVQRATLVVLVDGKEIARQDIGGDDRKEIRLGKMLKLGAGRHRFGVRLIPRRPERGEEGRLVAQVTGLRVRGPLDAGSRAFPESYRTIMIDGSPPDGDRARRTYAEKIFRRFAGRAFRRPVDDATVQRLADMVMAHDAEEGTSFADGVRLAVTAVLASPRFLFRAEVQPEADNPARIVPVDAHALASRLSYFLWSSMPDDELFRLAAQGKLRGNLDRQVDRMLADGKSERFVRNFTGQWLQARDVESVPVNARSILKVRRLRDAARMFNFRLREDMRRETEMLFGHVLREGRPATELLTARYGFLNERLAKFYQIGGVEGDRFRMVRFDDEDHRGGVLAQGTFLVVTSNPTRTSPVKRGLFVLENILGTPPPPAPPGVPTLEEVAKAEGNPLTMREAMVRHREDPLCRSCHARMDPIGLALENYNALGMWRDQEDGKPIDTAGELVTGEEFGSLEELKEVLGSSRRGDFHRCLAEKLMTYALGRGVEYYDAPSIDAIVADAERSGGTLKGFVKGVVRTAAFQKRRGDGSGLEK